HSAGEGQRWERHQQHAVPGVGAAWPRPSERTSCVRETRRGSVTDLLVREPLARAGRSTRGGVPQARVRLEILRGAGSVVPDDRGLLGHEREARGNPNKQAGKANRVHEEGSEYTFFRTRVYSFFL